jgi:hypothetical protein
VRTDGRLPPIVASESHAPCPNLQL